MTEEIDQEQKNVEQCSKLLTSHKMSLAFAESATAGMVMASFSRTMHSGKVLKGGVVCYDACLKQDILNVPKDVIEKFSPESLEVTRLIAKNLRKLVDAELYIGITGLTKPGGSETKEKPVGSMFICIHHNDWEILDHNIFEGTEGDIVKATIIKLCNLIVGKLSDLKQNTSN